MNIFFENLNKESTWRNDFEALLSQQYENKYTVYQSEQIENDEDGWGHLLEKIEKEDLVLITSVKSIEEKVKAVQNKKGIPILVTSSNNEGNKMMKQLWREEGIYFIDLFEYSSFVKEYKAELSDNMHEVMGKYVLQRLQPLLMESSMFNKYYYGACMYPELWSEEIVKADIKLMKSINMNFARIGEFIWSTLEPREGEYDLSFLENVISWYQEEDIDLVLCIPTPTPPIWMTKDHPERCIHNIDGTIMVHGSRQHACTNNAYFRDRAYLITQKIAKLADKFSNVIGIQLDNEFKCHVDLCYCDSCKAQWHDWLEDTYGNIENLNMSWGTRIWSEEYLAFDDVPVPTTTPFLHNSSLMNAFRKFTAETLNDFATGLCHMIRMETDIPITHNSAMGFNLLNDELFHELDFVGFDTYAPASNHPAFTINLDVWRNMKDKVNEYMLLETSTSHAGHIENYISPHPVKYLQTEVFAGFAGGLKAFTYWHFRGHRYGVEQPHSTVVSPWGEAGNGYEDVVESGKLIKEMSTHLEKTEQAKASIGFIYSDDARRHYNIETGGVYNYRGLITDLYASLVRKGLSVEVVQEAADLSDFKLLFVPFIRHLSTYMLEKIKAFVAKGGKVIFGPMTGDRTDELALHANNGLGDLGEWFSFKNIRQLSVHHYDYLTDGKPFEEALDRLVTVFEPKSDWEVLVQTHANEIVAAKGKVGQGSVVYIGATPKDLINSDLWSNFLEEEVIPYDRDLEYLSLQTDIVKYRRESSDTIQFYLVNMTDTAQQFTLEVSAEELLEGKALTAGQHVLESYEYKIIQIEK